MPDLLFRHGDDWNIDTLYRCDEAVASVALKDLGLSIYPNEFVIISSSDMLDAYASHGLPFMYNHWSFGQRYRRDQADYAKTGSLAYELVINSNPCVSWNMANNTATQMLLVMAHAAYGHNHFFKNNHLFQQWTNADGMKDYLLYAKNYIHQCEERYGADHVEMILDAAHALQFPCGVFRSQRVRQLSPRKEQERLKERLRLMEQAVDPRWHDVVPRVKDQPTEEEMLRQLMRLPEENVLYFLEKYSPGLKDYEREILRIVRVLAQYLYPQIQTKTMNEGCATFVHKYILDELYRRGQIDDGTLMEAYNLHASVVKQWQYKETGHFHGFNPYHMGWKMCEEIRRVSVSPTDEDRKWFQGRDWVGKGAWREELLHAWHNYRDESFILQYMTPNLMREMRLFSLKVDEDDEDFMIVEHIHREGDYHGLRDTLAEGYEFMRIFPDIQITKCDMKKDRTLTLTYSPVDGKELEPESTKEVLNYIELLWGYPVKLE